MDPQIKKVLEEMERNSSIGLDQIYDIAYAIQYEDLSDEMTVRALIRRFVNLVGSPVSQEEEDEIAHAMMDNDTPLSIDAWDRY